MIKVMTTQQFKDTEIGRIPKEWEVVRVRDVIRDALPGFASGKRDENGIIQLRMDSITTDGKIDPTKYVKVPRFEGVEKYLLKPGDVLFNNTNSLDLIGKTALYRGEHEEAVYSNHLTRIRTREDVLLPEWLTFVFLRLWTNRFFSRIAHPHVNQAGVNRDSLLSVRIPLPPLEEQKTIAYILSTVDKAIELTDKIIEKTERAKQALMNKLLTEGIGHTGFKDTEIGRIPKEWRVVRLRDVLLLLRNGATVTKQKKHGKYAITRIETISDEKIDTGKLGYVDNIDPKTLEEYRMIPGDILFSHINSIDQIGKTALYEGEPPLLIHGMNLLLLRPNEQITYSYFLLYLLKYLRFKRYFERLAQRAVNQASINQTLLGNTRIPLPPLEEQKKIAQILLSVDKKIEVERKEKEKLERIKRALMDILLSGRVRVKVV